MESSAGPEPRAASAPVVRAAPVPLTAAEFAAQFKASFRLLWIVAVGITRDAALAEDVVQEAALIALGKLNEFVPGTNFRAWMAQTVRYVALNAVRREHKRQRVELDEAELERSSAVDPTVQEQHEFRLTPRGELPSDQRVFDDRLSAALNSLNETARACLLLRIVGGLQYAEIARILSIPEGTAMSHVHRTRKALRQRLGGTHETGRAPESHA